MFSNLGKKEIENIEAKVRHAYDGSSFGVQGNSFQNAQ